MTKKAYIKPLLKSFLIEPMDFLAASPNPKPSKPTSSISFSGDVKSGDNDDTDPWEDVKYTR